MRLAGEDVVGVAAAASHCAELQQRKLGVHALQGAQLELEPVS